MRTEKILLVDLCLWQGHHETYFVRILSLLAQNGYFVYASCTDNQQLKQIINRQNLPNCQVIDLQLSLSDRVLIRGFRLFDQLIERFWPQLPIRLWSLQGFLSIKRLLRQINNEVALVFVTYMDGMMPVAPMAVVNYFLPTAWIGLYMQPSYRGKVYWGTEKTLQRYYSEKVFAAPSCRAVLLLHPVYQRFFSLRSRSVQLLHLPELVDIKCSNRYQVADEILAKAYGRKIISLTGSLMPKRNLKLFLESCCHLDPDKFFCVVVGSLNPEQYSSEELTRINELKSLFADAAYIRLDHYIPTDEDFNALLRIANVIFLHYDSHPFSSNILIKAMALRKAVIVSRGYIMEQTVHKYGWGDVTGNEPSEIAQAIQRLTTDFAIAEEAYTTFLDDHAQGRFDQAILTACAS